MRFTRKKFTGIILEETIVGSGDNWHTPGITSRIEWLTENVGHDDYILWYGGLSSDNMFVEFRNDQDATLYKLTWMTKDGSNK